MTRHAIGRQAFSAVLWGSFFDHWAVPYVEVCSTPAIGRQASGLCSKIAVNGHEQFDNSQFSILNS
jgi:hypothetical protein